MCGLAHKFEDGAAQQGRLQPRNNGDSWALGAGPGEEPQTDVHTLPWAAVAGWGSRRPAVLPARAPNPFCRLGVGACFTASAVLFVLRHTTWCRRAHRLSTRSPGPTLKNATVGDVGGRRRQLCPTQRRQGRSPKSGRCGRRQGVDVGVVQDSAVQGALYSASTSRACSI